MTEPRATKQSRLIGVAQDIRANLIMLNQVIKHTGKSTHPSKWKSTLDPGNGNHNMGSLDQAFKLIGKNTSRQGSQNSNLSAAEERIQEKGLSLIPTEDSGLPKQPEMDANVMQYHRKLKTASFFEPHDTKEHPVRTLFTTKWNWEPPLQKIPQNLSDLTQLDKTTIKNLPITKNTKNSNLTYQEKLAT